MTVSSQMARLPEEEHPATEVCSTEIRLLEGKPFGAFAFPANLSRRTYKTFVLHGNAELKKIDKTKW